MCDSCWTGKDGGPGVAGGLVSQLMHVCSAFRVTSFTK